MRLVWTFNYKECIKRGHISFNIQLWFIDPKMYTYEFHHFHSDFLLWSVQPFHRLPEPVENASIVWLSSGSIVLVGGYLTEKKIWTPSVKVMKKSKPGKPTGQWTALPAANTLLTAKPVLCGAGDNRVFLFNREDLFILNLPDGNDENACWTKVERSLALQLLPIRNRRSNWFDTSFGTCIHLIKSGSVRPNMLG